MDYQEWGQCDKIQNAISVGVESRKLKLWILDKGNDKCAPKLWSFSLLYNHILENIDFIGVPKTSLYTLVIGQRNTDHENKAFIGNAGKSKYLYEIMQKVEKLFNIYFDEIKLEHLMKNNELY